MPGWLQAVLITAGVIVASWLVLIILARRLPPGLARDLAAFLPDCVTTVRRLRRDPRVPRRAKIAIAVAAVWVISPIDLIPEFLPVIGLVRLPGTSMRWLRPSERCGQAVDCG